MVTIVEYLRELSYPAKFFIGLGINLFVGMRRFNRRGHGGLQHYSNYFVGLITTIFEGLLKILALGLMLWGVGGWIFRDSMG
ncbi:hypothetical protein Lbys_0991 [Leadbetterella byssophila DSM 17132]|uniref:Uncharacterized protein n=1 Tax=Leadbetterella byssophila (strain DSM 17132 / JCM 16389 / KACC 11308 / NBRC 106382 / 4M15) TaxID=649349 RepID=E4RS69_LEAB4|nr:hypothetical protein Lbys_0991 [Leadbetterella byssophila DSM 17132]